MNNDVLISHETLKKLNIDSEEAIEYLEGKKAIEINPIHVMALQTLKRRPVASS